MPARFGVVLLPGGVLPADLAYGALLERLEGEFDARPKDLELYRGDAPPSGYSLNDEVAGILSFADEAGFDRFHLVGYSAGGASSLAFCDRHPERLVSLVLNEPAWAGQSTFDDDERELWRHFLDLEQLPEDQRMARFARLQIREGVEPPSPPEGPEPPWMAKRPPSLVAVLHAFDSYEPDWSRLAQFKGPVLYTLGGRSNPLYYERQASRLATVFPDFTLELFPERHHFDPPHRVEPDRVAALLRTFWERAESKTASVE